MFGCESVRKKFISDFRRDRQRTEDPGFPNEMVCKGFVERMKNAKAPDEILDAVTVVSRSLCQK